MTETKRGRRLAVGFAALAAAGVIGGVTAVSLVGQQQPPAAEQVRTVSDEASVMPTPTAEATTASPTTPAATAPAATPSKTATKTTTRSRTTVTEPEPAPEPTEPTTEPPAPPGNSAPSGVETPPVGDPPPPPPGMECLPQEIGINPRCPATAPAG